MMDLIEFLQARFDEDAELARQARDVGGAPAWDPAADVLLTSGLANRRRLADRGVPDALKGAVEAHMARHDPARVLREVDAKRAVVQGYERALENRRAHPGDLASAGALLALHGAVKHLALPFADHPDYRPEWAPTA
jgi:hypothetical protein